MVTAEGARRLDQAASELMKVRSELLMDQAARGLAEAVLSRARELASRRIVVVAGPGNNGGDGIACLWHLLIKRQAGDEVPPLELILTRPPDKVRLPGKLFLRQLMVGFGLEPRVVESAEWLASRLLADQPLVVDAVLGTGVEQPLTGRVAEVVEVLSRVSPRRLIACDLPSGLDATSGELWGEVPRAGITVAMGHYKAGHLLGEGIAHSGRLKLVPLGFMPVEMALVERVLEPSQVAVALDGAFVRRTLPRLTLPADPTLHKHRRGRVVVIAGSGELEGAAVMAAHAALAAGAGLVRLAVPGGIYAAARSLAPEEITMRTVGEGAEFAPDDAGELEQDLEWADAVALGPGLGRSAEVSEFAQRVLEGLDKPAVVDADGLWGLEGMLPWEGGAELVITPHPGEMGRLCDLIGLDFTDFELDLFSSAHRFAERFGVALVYKHYRPLLAVPSGRVGREGVQLAIALRGAPQMASAGMGDVLTGIIATMLTREGSLLERVGAAICWHTLTGELAARLHPQGIPATRVASMLSRSLRMILGRGE